MLRHPQGQHPLKGSQCPLTEHCVIIKVDGHHLWKVGKHHIILQGILAAPIRII